MKKHESLRAHLLANVPALKRHPDRLLVFIDKGSVRATVAEGMSFEYAYTLNLIVTDWAGHPDAIVVPLLGWVAVYQQELLANIDKGREAIQFEADILDQSKVDLSLSLPLTERVIVTRQADGSLSIDHVGEPSLATDFGNSPELLEWRVD